jgi:hypothetical protein
MNVGLKVGTVQYATVFLTTNCFLIPGEGEGREGGGVDL